jgi:hypothetical protein
MMTDKYVTIHEGEGIKVLTPRAWYELTKERYYNDQCTECGKGLYLSYHVKDIDRRKKLEPLFEDNYNGLCYGCWNEWLHEIANDYETQAAL